MSQETNTNQTLPAAFVPFGAYNVDPNPFPIDAWCQENYPEWFEEHKATAEELDTQRKTYANSVYQPTFSFIVPLFKTSSEYLHTMADSVLAQTYPNLQLVLVNASPEIERLASEVAEYAAQDSRVTVVTLEKNLGITENTNEGLKAATGEFCCFLDHDDYIEPNLLFEYVKALNEDSAIDVLYCDEDLVERNSETGEFNHLHVLFKPALTPELLLCKNAIVHLMTIRRTLIDQMETPDVRYDGAQDYNMILFATNKARKTYGVQKVLYHWRISENSTAANSDAKPYSQKSYRLAALGEIERRNIAADIVASGIVNVHNLWLKKVPTTKEGSAAKVSVIVDCLPWVSEKPTPAARAYNTIARFVEFFAQNSNSLVGEGRNIELILVGIDKLSSNVYLSSNELNSPAFKERLIFVPTTDASTYARLNKAAAQATGDYLVFLDAGCYFETPEPLQQLTAMAALDGVGIASPKTLYRNGRNKIYGVAVTPERIMPLYRGYEDDFPGYQCNIRAFQNASACGLQGLTISRELFQTLGGFDEDFTSEVGAAELCQRALKQGYRIAQTCTVKLHTDDECPINFFNCRENAPDYSPQDVALFDAKHPGVRAAGDPYFSSNFNQSSSYCQIPDDKVEIMNFKLANVLLSQNQPFVDGSALLCRSTAPWTVNTDGTTAFQPGTHDFLTYFNAFSIEKWQRYTTARAFGLHLEIKGNAHIVQTHANAFSRQAEPVEANQADVTSEDWQAVDFELIQQEGDVSLAFLITSETGFSLRNSYYYTTVKPEDLRPVELSLCTTTFKKEEYITRNINLVKDEILASQDPIANHFYMHVMDNGRTLDAEALSQGAITVHPTNNVGGAGGFARGMIESMEQTPKATHVLLMDDDVLISTESLKRTYALLSLVNDEYKDAFIGGAMMSMEEPTVLYEDLAYMQASGFCTRMKLDMHVDLPHNVVANETFNVPLEYPDCQDQTQQYAAWWYCVVPMTQIEKNGMPMPIFVRYDDVEYSLRCKPKFIHINGICVWHMPFFMRYSGSQECYQTTRNCLVNSYTTNFAPMSDFTASIEEAFNSRITRFHYADAELIVRGLQDFLKGPEWLGTKEAQGAFVANSKLNEKFYTFEELKDELAALGVNPYELTDWKIYRNAMRKTLPKRAANRILFEQTLNGQKGGSSYTAPGRVAIVDAFNFGDHETRFMRAETIVAVDIPNGKVAIRKKDQARFDDIYSRFTACMAELKKRDAELHKLYADARAELTSVEYWKKYLEI